MRRAVQLYWLKHRSQNRIVVPLVKGRKSIFARSLDTPPPALTVTQAVAATTTAALASSEVLVVSKALLAKAMALTIVGAVATFALLLHANTLLRVTERVSHALGGYFPA
jgi:hypothetical protein